MVSKTYKVTYIFKLYNETRHFFKKIGFDLINLVDMVFEKLSFVVIAIFMITNISYSNKKFQYNKN